MPQDSPPPHPATADSEKPVREIRINPIVPSESVLVATARSLRPKKAEAPAPRDTRAHVDTCPFCVGNEHMTPPAIGAYPEGAPWQLLVPSMVLATILLSLKFLGDGLRDALDPRQR